ncbi:MAG: hypothetical protein V9E94_01220 [Microthrixaceae bacterium]
MTEHEAPIGRMSPVLYEQLFVCERLQGRMHAARHKILAYKPGEAWKKIDYRVDIERQTATCLGVAFRLLSDFAWLRAFGRDTLVIRLGWVLDQSSGAPVVLAQMAVTEDGTVMNLGSPSIKSAMDNAEDTQRLLDTFFVNLLEAVAGVLPVVDLSSPANAAPPAT